MPYVKVDDFRNLIKSSPTTVEGYLSRLEQKKSATPTDVTNRGKLTQTTHVDQYNRDWTGAWGWSLYKRVLPDDKDSRRRLGSLDIWVWLHLKSLERGSHDSVYYMYTQPNSFYKAYPTASVAPKGWTYDPAWIPRLLWKQERPNARLYLAPPGVRPEEASDLSNSISRRVLAGGPSLDETAAPPNQAPDSDDDKSHRTAAWSMMGTTHQEQVVDYVLEETLGYANQSFTPELDRNGAQIR